MQVIMLKITIATKGELYYPVDFALDAVEEVIDKLRKKVSMDKEAQHKPLRITVSTPEAKAIAKIEVEDET